MGKIMVTHFVTANKYYAAHLLLIGVIPLSLLFSYLGCRNIWQALLFFFRNCLTIFYAILEFPT